MLLQKDRTRATRFRFSPRTLGTRIALTKVIAINESARKDGNTAILIRRKLKELENESIETDWSSLPAEKFRGAPPA